MATKVLMTLEEFDALPDDDSVKYELNKGELEIMTLPMPRHNRVIRRIQLLIERYLEQHPIGEVFLPDTPFILSGPGEPVTLRGADLTYLSRERLAAIDMDKKIQGAADLTIEVVSPSDKLNKLLEKVAQYLDAVGHSVGGLPGRARGARLRSLGRNPHFEGIRHHRRPRSPARFFCSDRPLFRVVQNPIHREPAQRTALSSHQRRAGALYRSALPGILVS